MNSGYRTAVIPAPFVEFDAPPFVLTARWSRSDFIGYIGTWSSVHRHRSRTGHDPVAPFAAALAAQWADDEQREVRWDLALRVMRRA